MVVDVRVTRDPLAMQLQPDSPVFWIRVAISDDNWEPQYGGRRDADEPKYNAAPRPEAVVWQVPPAPIAAHPVHGGEQAAFERRGDHEGDSDGAACLGAHAESRAHATWHGDASGVGEDSPRARPNAALLGLVSLGVAQKRLGPKTTTEKSWIW